MCRQNSNANEKSRKLLFRELEQASNQGLNASTIELAERYLRDFPASGWAWLDYGKALANFGLHKQAEFALRRALKYVPSTTFRFVYRYLGDVYEDAGNYRKATSWYGRAVKAAPHNANHLNMLAYVLVRAGNPAEATKYLQRATKCREGAIDEAYYNLGCVLAAKRKYARALTCFEKALELDPKYKVAKQARQDMKRVLQITAR